MSAIDAGSSKASSQVITRAGIAAQRQLSTVVFGS